MFQIFAEVLAVCLMCVLPLMLFAGRRSRGRGGKKGGRIRIGPSAPGILLWAILRSLDTFILLIATAVFFTAVIIMARA